LSQGPCTHRTRLKRHQQGAVVEAPIASQPSRLSDGYQLGMPKRVAVAFTLIAAMADATTLCIKNHGDHWNFPKSSEMVCTH